MSTATATDVVVDYKAQFVNGRLDRAAGNAIKTREEHQAANPDVDPTDLEDLYRAYRNGFIANEATTK